jgi:hypothetical protein
MSNAVLTVMMCVTFSMTACASSTPNRAAIHPAPSSAAAALAATRQLSSRRGLAAAQAAYNPLAPVPWRPKMKTASSTWMKAGRLDVNP